MQGDQITQILHFIEDNLEDPIHLARVAEASHYSMYHFHRLFSKAVGLSVSQYVKLRRTRLAMHYLMHTNDRVTDIALYLGFGSVDTMIRNFKDLYNITPRAYRQYRRQETKEEEKCVMDMYLKRLEKIDLETRLKSTEAVARISNLSTLQHQGGLFAFEAILKDEASPFVKKGMELIVDGCMPSEIRGILSNYLHYSSLTDEVYFDRLLYMEGLLMIQAGVYPWDIRQKLFSYFGESNMKALEDQFKNAHWQDDYEQSFVETTKNADLVKALQQLNPRRLQRLLRECDKMTLTVAILGLPRTLKATVLDNLSQRVKDHLYELYHMFEGVQVAQVVDAQHAMLASLKKLKLDGEI